jgi:TPR repeat protein
MACKVRDIRQCGFCSIDGHRKDEPEIGILLFDCSRCLKELYCGKECQRAAWVTHKASCFSPEECKPSAKKLAKVKNPCPVCYEELEGDLHEPPCLHKLHMECLLKMPLATAALPKRCPVCRCMLQLSPIENVSFDKVLREASAELKKLTVGTKKWVEVLTTIQIYADTGHTNSQFSFGRIVYIYVTGALRFGAETSSLDEAIEYLERAADKKHVKAAYYLGILYREGKHVPQDSAKALKYFLIAAEGGNAQTMFWCGCYYDAGIGCDPNPAESMRWFLAAAESGFFEAMARYGEAVTYGFDLSPPNPKEGLRWSLKAANNTKNPLAARTAAIIYLDGMVYRKNAANLATGVDWLRNSAKWGSTCSMFDLARLYWKGDLIPRSTSCAMFWLSLSQTPAALHELGVIYGKGIEEDGVVIVKVDYNKGVRFFTRAAEKGFVESIDALIELYSKMGDQLMVEKWRSAKDKVSE